MTQLLGTKDVVKLYFYDQILSGLGLKLSYLLYLSSFSVGHVCSPFEFLFSC